MICGCCKRSANLVIELPGYGGVCAGCKKLIVMPTSGIAPTAFEQGSEIRMVRPKSNRL
jgi:hypothetical protein